jgi:hypothetical protein
MESLGLNNNLGYNEEICVFMIQIGTLWLYAESLIMNSSIGYNEEMCVLMIQIRTLVSLFWIIGSEQ